MADEKEKESKADAGKEGTTLDKLLKGIDAATAKLDSMGSRMDAFEKRMDDDAKRRKDAEEEEEKKEKERDDAARKDAAKKDEDKEEKEEGEPKPVAADKKKRKDDDDDGRKDAKADAEEKKDDDDGRKDSKKDDDDGRKDTEEDEKNMKKDSAADAIAAIEQRLDEKYKARIAALEAQMPKSMADKDFDTLAEKRAAIDDAYHSFGQTAPRPLSGENILTYRKRALRPLQKHSDRWKEVDLGAIAADEAAFNLAEGQILADAKAKARDPQSVPAGQLRAVTSRDDSGHTITRFYGRPSVWMNRYMPNRRYVKAIDMKKGN